MLGLKEDGLSSVNINPNAILVHKVARKTVPFSGIKRTVDNTIDAIIRKINDMK